MGNLAYILSFILAIFISAASAVRGAEDDTPVAAMPAVPSEAAQEAAVQTIKQLFKQDIDAAKNGAQKLDLARKLLQQGIETQGDPAGRYALLRMARDYATGVADPGVAMQAIDEMGRSFAMDIAQAKLESIAALSKQPLTPAQNKALVEVASLAMDDAIATDDFEVATKAGALGSAAAKKSHDPEFIKQFASRSKEVEEMQAAYANVSTSLKALDEKPLDPAANFAVGFFRAMVKSDWDAGVPFLALGDEPKLKAVAVLELNATDATEELVKVADAWWVYAAGQEATLREHSESRALFWYGKAQPRLTGLLKLRVDKLMQEVNVRMFTRIQTAQRLKKYTIAPAVGGIRGTPFNIDGVPSGGLLIGLEVGEASLGGGDKFIGMVRPIFATSMGEVKGVAHGQTRGQLLTIKAREGFAISGLTLKASNRIDGLSVTFMQIQGTSLNSRNSYASEWYGSKGTSAEMRIGGSGAPVIGVSGRTIQGDRNNGSFLESLSLVLAR